MKDADFERKITINQNKNKMNTIKWLEIAEGFNKCIESALEINRQRKEKIIELIEKRQKETIKENKMEEKSNVNTQVLISKEQMREWAEESVRDILQERLDKNKSVLDFQSDLRKLINRHSKENDSDTPDFILAEYLNNSLENFNDAIHKTNSHELSKEEKKYTIEDVRNILKDYRQFVWQNGLQSHDSDKWINDKLINSKND